MVGPKVGDKWGALECLHAGRIVQEKMSIDADGNEYVSDRWTATGYQFKCACGTIFAVADREFKGRRQVRDCGCGSAGFSGENVVMAFSTNTGVQGHVKELARHDGQSVSYVINEALRRYFEYRAGGESGDGDNGDDKPHGLKPVPIVTRVM
jgi:hypothetical protein